MINRYEKIKNRTTGQATLEFAMAIPLVIIIILAASQVGFLVYSRILVQHASREAVRILSTTNDNILAVNTARSICGSDSEISIEPREASQRSLGDMVSVSVSRPAAGLEKILGKILYRDLAIRAYSFMRMEVE